MRYLMTLLLLAALAILAAPQAAGQTAPTGARTSPYEVTVPVADMSPTSRNDAFAAALAEVVERVAGHAPSSSVLGQASTYVRQYRYQRAPAGSAQPFELKVLFAASAIEHLTDARPLPAPVAANGVAGTTAGSPFAMPGGGDSTVWISGIRSALDYAHALATLRDAAGVDSAAVRRAHGNGMLLDIRTIVPLSQVLAGLESGGRLTAAAAAHAGATASLRWHP